MTTAYINRIATAVPPHDVHATFLRFARSMFGNDWRRSALFQRMAERSGIEHRYSCLAPAADPDGPTVDLDIELEFTRNPDGTVQGRLIGTSLGKIDKPLRGFTMHGRQMTFELPNTQPWLLDGELSTDGSSIVAVLNNLQGTLPVTFKKRA